MDGGPYELIAYGQKTTNAFTDLQRGFAGSKQTYWPARTSYVSNAVSADHHNAPKDALINIENDLGTDENPEATSLNGILKWQEIRFLTPKPIFRASVRKGKAPLKVRFQNFTTGHIVRNFWDFGDGTTSVEKSPSHTYVAEGDYTVKLNVITSTGGQGLCTKTGYITIDNNETPAFMYVDSTSDPYSVESASLRTQGKFPPDYIAVDTDAKEFTFVDQTDGDIVERHWIFGDGTTVTERDPDRHWVTHIYLNPSTAPGYYVSCLTVLSNGRLKRAQLGDPLTVL
jgi:PKD repeat protein